MKEIVCNLSGFTFEHNLYVIENGVVKQSKPVEYEYMSEEIVNTIEKTGITTIHFYGLEEFTTTIEEQIKSTLNFSNQELKFIYN